MRRHMRASRGVGFVTVFMRAKTGPCRPFVFVMCRMYHCHLNAASDNGGLRETDEMRRWNGNQSHSRLLNDGRGHRAQARREKDLDMCVTWKHDGKWVYMKKNWTRLMTLYSVCRLFRYLQIVFKLTNTKKKPEWILTLYRLLSHAMTFCFEIGLRHWFPSLSVLCLLLIAIRVTRAHTGDCLITHSFSTCPSIIPTDAIIHVAISINTFKRSAVKLWVMWLRLISFMASLLRSFYYLEFTSHLLSICRLNGPFIRLYVATELSVGGWFTDISSFGKKVTPLRFFMNEKLFLI